MCTPRYRRWIFRGCYGACAGATMFGMFFFFFFSSRRRHTRCSRDWSSDVCSSDLAARALRLQPVEVTVVEVERRVLRGDRGHAIELRLRQLEPPRPDVEERVLPDDGPHPETELLRGLDPVGGGRRRGVLGVDELGGGRDPLLELRMAAEEEGLEAPPVLRLRQEELEHLGRLVRIVARADKLLHAALVRLALEVAAIARDRGRIGQR